MIFTLVYIDCPGPVATLISLVPVVTTAGLSRSPLYINEAQNVAIKVCIYMDETGNKLHCNTTMGK